MDNKRNEATLNRPEGDRVINAPYVFGDIDEAIRQLKEEDAWAKNDRNAITLFKGDDVTIVLTCLHEKARIDNNSVDGIFTVQLMDGRINIQSPDGDIQMKPNQFVSFHRRVDHSIEAIDDATLLLTIHR